LSKKTDRNIKTFDSQSKCYNSIAPEFSQIVEN